MPYRIEIRPSAQKGILPLPSKAQRTVAHLIDGLSANPRPHGTKKLRDTGLWRLRFGRYRVVYFLDDQAKMVIIVRVATRDEGTYRNL